MDGLEWNLFFKWTIFGVPLILRNLAGLLRKEALFVFLTAECHYSSTRNLRFEYVDILYASMQTYFNVNKPEHLFRSLRHVKTSPHLLGLGVSHIGTLPY